MGYPGGGCGTGLSSHWAATGGREVECVSPKKGPKQGKGDGSGSEVDGDRQTSRGHALLPAVGNYMIQGWSQSSDLDKDKSFSMLIDWIPEGDGLLEAGALRKRVQDEWGRAVTTPPHGC